MDDKSKLPKKRIAIFRELDKGSRGDWIDNLGAISVAVLGLVVGLVCGGSAMLGDFNGSHGGLAEANRQRLQYSIFLAIPGFVIAAIGFWRLIRVNFPRK